LWRKNSKSPPKKRNLIIRNYRKLKDLDNLQKWKIMRKLSLRKIKKRKIKSPNNKRIIKIRKNKKNKKN